MPAREDRPGIEEGELWCEILISAVTAASVLAGCGDDRVTEADFASACTSAFRAEAKAGKVTGVLASAPDKVCTCMAGKLVNDPAFPEAARRVMVKSFEATERRDVTARAMAERDLVEGRIAGASRMFAALNACKKAASPS